MNRSHPAADGVSELLDRLAAAEPVQSNCMFQLAIMLARVAAEPCPDSYKEEAAQAMLQLIRQKPKSNVVRLFRNASSQNCVVETSQASA